MRECCLRHFARSDAGSLDGQDLQVLVVKVGGSGHCGFFNAMSTWSWTIRCGLDTGSVESRVKTTTIIKNRLRKLYATMFVRFRCGEQIEGAWRRTWDAEVAPSSSARHGETGWHAATATPSQIVFHCTVTAQTQSCWGVVGFVLTSTNAVCQLSTHVVTARMREESNLKRLVVGCNLKIPVIVGTPQVSVLVVTDADLSGDVKDRRSYSSRQR